MNKIDSDTLQEVEQTLDVAAVKRFESYPSYKPSGVYWLGVVPEHWEVKKITHGFKKIGSGTTPSTDAYDDYYEGAIPWVTTSELRETLISDTNKKITDKALRDYSSLKLFEPGTLLIAMYGATIGRLGLLDIQATVNQACCAFSDPKGMDPKFVYYWLLSRREILIALAYGGGQPNLSQDDIRQIRIPSPDISEQQAIARFLDEQTRKIDNLIEAKRKLLNLLKEKRQAIITHAVTKGIDLDVKLKPSGIEWLGDVPEQWEVKRLKYLVTINDEVLSESTDPSYEFKYIEISSVDSINGIISEAPMNFENAPSRARRVVRNGDLIISTVRTYLRAIAPIRNIKNDLIVSTGFAVLRPRNIDSNFLSYALRSEFFIDEVVSRSTGVSYPAINSSEIGDIHISVPDKIEQEAISRFLDDQLKKLDSIVSETNKAIERLTEYRTALISAAVTGKIDVRGRAS